MPQVCLSETKCCVASCRMNQFWSTASARLPASCATPGPLAKERKSCGHETRDDEFHRFGNIFWQAPSSFDWKFRDSDKKFHCFKGLTPKILQRSCAFDIDAHVSLFTPAQRVLQAILGCSPWQYQGFPIAMSTCQSMCWKATTKYRPGQAGGFDVMSARTCSANMGCSTPTCMTSSLLLDRFRHG